MERRRGLISFSKFMSSPESQPAQLSSTGTPRTTEAFNALLADMIQFPERRTELEKAILSTFSVPKAVLVLDMSGFSRTTRMHGIVSFLLMIFQTRRLCEPSITKHHGILVKAEADNLFCLFDEVPQAIGAAREIIDRLETANCVLPDDRRLYASIGIGYGPTLYVGDEDLFGDEVNLASKLGEDIAGAGEVLLTAEAAAKVPEEAARATKTTASISGMALDYWKVNL
jgi:adenylate cyclase